MEKVSGLLLMSAREGGEGCGGQNISPFTLWAGSCQFSISAIHTLWDPGHLGRAYSLQDRGNGFVMNYMLTKLTII